MTSANAATPQSGLPISNEERGLTPYVGSAGSAGSTGGMLMPLTDSAGARAAIEAYESLKTAIVRPDDIQRIQGRDFLKKSFWRRVSACFGLSLELVGEERLILDGRLAYRATYRAIAPNGRTMDGDGMCSNAEKGREQWPEHNVRATAHTRAKNRAISDIVGGGEVSAEEMQDDNGGAFDNAPRHKEARPAAQLAGPAVRPAERAERAERVSHALRQTDILQLLNRLGRRSMDDQRRELEAVFSAIEAAGQTVNLKNVKAEIQARIDDFNAVDAADANAADNTYDLENMPVGEPGAGVH